MSCAQRVEGVWRSRCKRCGAKLVRVQRKWRETAKVDVLALRQQLLRHLDQRYARVDQHGADLRGAFLKRGFELAPGHDIVAARNRIGDRRSAISGKTQVPLMQPASLRSIGAAFYSRF